MSEWVRTERGTLVKRYGAGRDFRAPASGLCCPRVITDTMDPTEHIDGKYYTSKSEFRAVTKAHGMVEVGNDPARLRPPAPPQPNRAARREAVSKAVAQSGI